MLSSHHYCLGKPNSLYHLLVFLHLHPSQKPCKQTYHHQAYLDQQIRWQVLAIGSAANDLGMLLTQAPVDPAQANDWVLGVAEPAQRAQASVDEVTTRLDAMLSADGFLDGIGKAGEVITSGADAVTAGQELLTAVQQASDQAQAEFAPAFAAAPSCQS